MKKKRKKNKKIEMNMKKNNSISERNREILE